MLDSQRSNRLIQKSHPILKASAYLVCTVQYRLGSVGLSQFLHNDAQCSGGVVQVCRWNTSFQSPAYVLIYMHVFTRMSTNLNCRYCIIDVKMLKISSGASSVKVHLLCFCWNSLSQYIHSTPNHFYKFRINCFQQPFPGIKNRSHRLEQIKTLVS